jgi:DNA-binding response OmpR family regulator
MPARHPRSHRSELDPASTPNMLRRVLVVEDDATIRRLIVKHLESEGYRVAEASDGPTALAELRQSAPHLVILDLGLPGLDGREVLVHIRATGGILCIVISGRADEHDRVLGLDLGADDYVVKPLSIRELGARVRALFRRSTAQQRPRLLDFGDLQLDLDACEVRLDGAVVPMPAKEFQLLQFLASSPRRTFTREQLLERVWNSMGDWQDPATVTEHVRRIRHKIEPDRRRPRRIITVWGLGYRFEP